MSTRMNRRAILAGAAATAAVAMPAAALPMPDPIYAAIEEHRRTRAAIEVLCDQQAELEKALPYAKRQTDIKGDIVATDDPRWITFCHTFAAAYGRDDDAESALLDTVPTTVAGVAALLEYGAEYVLSGGQWNEGYDAGDRAACGYVRKHGVKWETYCLMQCAKALRGTTALRLEVLRSLR